MRALVGIAVVLMTGRASAEEPNTLTVTGSSATSFGSRAKEGERPRDTPDAAALLEGLPGLRVRRLGAESSFATVSIRGAASNQVMISFAGVPLTGAADPSTDLATLPLWPGAVARVHRTFAPAHVGGGYLGGVVDLQPMELASRRSTEVYNAFGSFGSYRLRIADTRTNVLGFRVGAGVSYLRTNGDFTYFDPGLGRDTRRTNSDSAQLAGVVHARRDDEKWSWLVTLLGTTRHDGVAGSFIRPTLATEMFRDRLLAAIEARRRDDDGRTLARVWARRDGRTFEDPLGELGFLAGRSENRVLAVGSTVGRSHRASDHVTFDLRLDGAFEGSRGSPRIDDPSFSPTRDRLRLGAALDVLLQPTRTTTIALAHRSDVYADSGNDVASGNAFLPVTHLGVEHALGDNVTVGGHIGTVARAPSFLELLGDGGVYAPSPKLRSERGYAADLGVRAHAGKKVRFDVEAVGFAWEVRDLIVVVPVSVRFLRAENFGAARIVGGELSVAASTGPFRALVSYTRLHTENRTSIASERGAPLPGRPDHDLTTDLSARVGRVTFRYGFDVVSSTTLDRSGINRMPTRVYHSAGVRLDASPVSVIAEIINILDQRTVDVNYETGSPFRAYPISDFLGYPLPGRRFNLAVRGSF